MRLGLTPVHVPVFPVSGKALWIHQHTFFIILRGEDIVFHATDNLSGGVEWVMMQSCFGFHFTLVLEKLEKYDGHQQCFSTVQLIGTCNQAENFIVLS